MGNGVKSMAAALLLVAHGGSWAREVQSSMGAFNEHIVFSVSTMWTQHNTQLRLDGDLGLGIGADLEDLFDLDEELAGVVQFAIGGWFKQRHFLGMQYYAFKRDSKSVLQEEWVGNDIRASVGTEADAKLDITIVDLSYGYSFIENDRHQLYGTIGIYSMYLDFELDLEGDLIIDGEPVEQARYQTGQRLEVPLPVVGLVYNYAVTPRWMASVNIQYFTLRTSVVNGGLTKVSASTRYYFWDHFMLGGGLTSFDLSVEADLGDFEGRVDWTWWGPDVFIGARF